ncbi:hypothetical protein F8388_023314 [Cannabis sativa]|uniref:Uncharacterized protein n=1 Tax=Cannabis sativa TaxID=3483 RepID=A0A7J6DSP0_CANSA|nr:hypothetical protein G4B88_012756 [Cannabis sativa]KAF4393510.1 hypothetical protein F8388_023314 [Cannabis sativa]
MLGALQLDIMAAFVVVLVPMGMVRWHLSRNKMLFFSGALFITLAIDVHLTPYFPSVTDFVSSVSSVVIFDTRHSFGSVEMVRDRDGAAVGLQWCAAGFRGSSCVVRSRWV